LLLSVMTAAAQDRILVFTGVAGRSPTEEIAALFEIKTGIKAETEFGGSGYVLSQKNLIDYIGSCEKTDTAISLKQADTVIGWHVFEYLKSSGIVTEELYKSVTGLAGVVASKAFKFSAEGLAT
jgi:hypothetical protein